MTHLAFERSSTPLETILMRHPAQARAPVVYLLPPRTPSRQRAWAQGFGCGLTVATVMLAAAALVLG